MSETILIIGVRRRCYKAAMKLGYKVVLWSDGPLHESRQQGLHDWLEVPYSECQERLTPAVEDYLKSKNITRVLATSESTVTLGARVRKFLNIKPLGLKLTERFHNKFVMKNCAREANIPITRYELVRDETTPEFLIEKLGLPLVLKPVDESGARDVQVAKSMDEVRKNMEPGLIAEAFVSGSEVSVETFVQDGEPLFHNCTEYLHQWKKSAVPAQLDEDLQQQILDLNDKVIRHFKLDRGMTHAEFYLTENGPVFGEIAVRPPGGYYMELIQRVYGIDSWKTYVQLSCGQRVEGLNQKPKGQAAVLMFHPGPGEIAAIHGEQKVRDYLSDIIDFKIRKKPGDIIEEHTSTSNEVAHILFFEETREDLMSAIEFVETNLIFEMKG